MKKELLILTTREYVSKDTIKAVPCCDMMKTQLYAGVIFVATGGGSICIRSDVAGRGRSVRIDLCPWCGARVTRDIRAKDGTLL